MTDKELIVLLPTLNPAQQIEAIIGKYIAGIISSAYDGETDSETASAWMARALVGKIKTLAPAALRERAPSPDEKELRLKIWDTAAGFFDAKVDDKYPPEEYVKLERAFDGAITAALRAPSPPSPVTPEQVAWLESEIVRAESERDEARQNHRVAAHELENMQLVVTQLEQRLAGAPSPPPQTVELFKTNDEVEAFVAAAERGRHVPPQTVEQARTLADYAQHDDTCQAGFNALGEPCDCTCGLDAIIAAAQAVPAPSSP